MLIVVLEKVLVCKVLKCCNCGWVSYWWIVFVSVSLISSLKIKLVLEFGN